MNNLKIYLLFAAAILPFCGQSNALTLADFRLCVSSMGSAAYCTLDPGTHSISQTIYIERSGVQIEGDWTGSILRRQSGFTGALLEINQGYSVSNVVITNLTFLGNRAAGLGAGVELTMHNCANCRVTFNRFEDSPHIAVAIHPTNSQLTFRLNYVARAYHFGVWLGTGDCGVSSPAKCAYLYDNNFQDNGTNAIFSTASKVNIGYNTFTGNHRECSYAAPGGQIDLDFDSSNSVIFWNTIINGPTCPNGFWAQGIELHGTNLSAYDNIITGNAGEGIYMEETQFVNISATDVSRYIRWNNVKGSGFPGCGAFPGIRIHSLPGLRPTANITVQNASIVDGHSYGAEVSSCPQSVSVQNASSILITGNCFRGNNSTGGTNGVNVGPGSVSGLSINGNATASCGPN